MQAAAAATATAVCFTAPLPIRSTTKAFVPSSWKPRRTLIKPRAAAITTSPETSTIDYSSSISGGLCDIIGGEACDTKMFPEAKLAASSGDKNSTVLASEEVDRDYLEYNDTKTVFPGEACDDLGGEFCEAEYQNGVY